MMKRPSGVQIGELPSVASFVRRRGVPPAEGTIHRSPFGPSSGRKYTTEAPSGDSAGDSPTLLYQLSGTPSTRLALDPSAPTIQISFPPRSKTSRSPSAENRGLAPKLTTCRGVPPSGDTDQSPCPWRTKTI